MRRGKRTAEGRRRGCIGLWIAVAVVALCGRPGLAEEADEAEAAAAADLAQAEARFAAKDWAGAADAFAAAVVKWEAIHAQVEEDCAEMISDLGDGRGASSEGIAKRIRTGIEPLDRVERTLGGVELGLVRCAAQQKKAEEAARHLRRALGWDPDLRTEIGKEALLAGAAKAPPVADLIDRIERSRTSFDTGDPLETLFHERDFQRCLRLPPADPELGKASALTRSLRRLVARRTVDEIPSRFTMETYEPLGRRALLTWKQRGWPYLHSRLYEGGAEIRELADACLAHFEEGRDRPDAPFRAYLACFPAVHTGRLSVATELLDQLRKTAFRRYGETLEGVRALVEAYVDHGPGFPGAGRAASEAFGKDVRARWKEVEEALIALQAWQGIPDRMADHGVLRKDRAEGRPWLEAAHELGSKRGGVQLAVFLVQGIGGPKEAERAVALARQLAEEGFSDAMNTLAWAYQYGEGVEQDYVRARELFEQAAAKGHHMAMDSLGILHQRGLGGPVDNDAARRWYEKSVEAGFKRGRWRIGILRLETRASDTDLAEARKLLEEALEEEPADLGVLVYAWSAAVLQGRKDDAKRLALSFAAKEPGFEKDFAAALAKPTLDPATLVKKASATPSEDTRDGHLALVELAAGFQALAAGNRAKAKTLWTSCRGRAVKFSAPNTARVELERLEKK